MEDVEYGSRKRRKDYTPQKMAADVVGITTIIVSFVAFVVGETTKVFSWLKVGHPGAEFVFQYIAWPVLPFVQRYAAHALREKERPDCAGVIMATLVVTIVAAFFYSLIVYAIVRVFYVRSERKKREDRLEKLAERHRHPDP